MSTKAKTEAKPADESKPTYAQLAERAHALEKDRTYLWTTLAHAEAWALQAPREDIPDRIREILKKGLDGFKPFVPVERVMP